MRRAWVLSGLVLFGCSNEVTTSSSSGSTGSSSAHASSTSVTSSTGSGGQSSSSASTSSASGMGGGCNVPADCPASGCLVPTCENGVCGVANVADGTACEDGDLCTAPDLCMTGVCVPGAVAICEPSDACHVSMCNPQTGVCDEIPGNDGNPCEDGDLCTQDSVCAGGVCGAGTPVDCSASADQCNTAQCDPATGCFAAPIADGTSCDDGFFCTDADVCTGGKCGGAPKACPTPANACLVAACDENAKTCSTAHAADGLSCDDGNPCTINSTCMNGACNSGANVINGTSCDDGNACTASSLCSNGMCVGGSGPLAYFSDDFHNNSKGWQLGPEWQIGPAQMSPQGSFNPDPGQDHTASTSDNGVAGIVIGGNATTSTHAYEYLTSPAFDTSTASGPVILGFYRWLNSDYDPYMHNSIDVFNGSVWINVWTSSGAPGIQDSAWTYETYDLTAYKNAAMQIRFGMSVGAPGVFSVSSWNIDDVLVSNASCP